ncbi:MAG TPA: hypothetical protein VFF30_12280 [Nitrososphaerales archaeon]|nr:hypothetical protein [Nitrososphaerales archaeon]
MSLASFFCGFVVEVGDGITACKSRKADHSRTRLLILKMPKRHPRAFLSLVSFEVLRHTGAFGPTAYAVSHGLAKGGSPVYYLLSNRIVFMLQVYGMLVILSLVVWIVQKRSRIRLFHTVLISFVSAFDFAHGANLLYYHPYIFEMWKNWRGVIVFAL